MSGVGVRVAERVVPCGVKMMVKNSMRVMLGTDNLVTMCWRYEEKES